MRPKKKCVHYWMIDEKNHGVCQYCGDETDFPRITFALDIWKEKREKYQELRNAASIRSVEKDYQGYSKGS